MFSGLPSPASSPGGVAAPRTGGGGDGGSGRHPVTKPPALDVPSSPPGGASLHPPTAPGVPPPSRCLNPAALVNAGLDTQVEIRVYPCNHGDARRKSAQFHVRPEGVVIRGTHRHRAAAHGPDLGAAYAAHVGRELPCHELGDARACQLLVTTHGRSYYVVPAPEAFSRHSGTCRLLGDRKHPPAPHALRVGDFLRVGSVGVVVVEAHDGRECRVLSEEKIRKIVRDTTSGAAGFLDLAETDGENSDGSSVEGGGTPRAAAAPRAAAPPAAGQADDVPADVPTCYMCFDEADDADDPLVSPCKCLGSTRYVHLGCLRKWHTADADNDVCFLSSVDATCSVCKTTFKSDVKLKDGRTVKLFKSTLEPPYVTLLVATKHEMAQRLFNTRFQLSFSTLLKPDGRNGTRPLLLGRSSGSDMVLDYRTVSARHAAIRFKHGQFLFTDAGSSNGSYLYLRRPVELATGKAVQFRLGRSIISAKVVNRWNKRLLKAVARGLGGSSSHLARDAAGADDDRSVGSGNDDVRVTDAEGVALRRAPRRTRAEIMARMPPLGTLRQTSARHLDLLHALAYPAEGDRKAVAECRPPDAGGAAALASASAAPAPAVDEGPPAAGPPPAEHGVPPAPTFLTHDDPDEAPPPACALAPAPAPAVGVSEDAGSPREDEGAAPASAVAVSDVAQGMMSLNLEGRNEEELRMADFDIPPSPEARL